ncbi:hypothetical protein M9H77_25768 [Catharanthus roseus]|uniref:Uncharacterized protein n=1 Tax=Catharanthus roseus TaxID=4058 RepID=A0ACC0A9N0_CATRO|nr:hypothetical protein M9H77_25768 [Catharanthus roseus]
MNLVLSSSFNKYSNLRQQVKADQMDNIGGNNAGGGGGGELDRFLYDVEAIKDDMRTMEKLQKRLQEANEDSKNIRGASPMKELKAIMDSEVDHVLILAKSIMKRIEGLERSNLADRNNNNNKVGGQSSSLDRTRASVISGLGKKLREMMDDFQGLRAKMAAMYKENKQYIEAIENMLYSGEIEQVITEAIQEYGRDRVFDVIEEIQQRHEGAKYMQKNLIDLHRILLEMVSLVEAQGQKVMNQNDLVQQQQVLKGTSFIRAGAAQLHDSADDEKDAKKRATIALILVVVLIVILIVPLFRMETEKGRE